MPLEILSFMSIFLKKYIVIGLDIASETDELKNKEFYFYKCDLTK